MAKSILVTGTDYTGKTTLIDGLAEQYSSKGLTVIKNKFDLFKTPIYPLAEQMMRSDWENNKVEINSLLAASFIVDGALFKPEGDLFIQDSYFHRTLAFCEAYNIPYIKQLLIDANDRLYHFDVNILLYADLNVKKCRANRNGKFDLFDRAVFTSQDLVKKMDECLENAVKKEKNYLKIDTSKLSINQVLNEAMKYIDGLK